MKRLFVTFIVLASFVLEANEAYMGIGIGMLQAPKDVSSGYATELDIGMSLPSMADFFALEVNIIQTLIAPSANSEDITVSALAFYSVYMLESPDKQWLFMPKIGVMMPNLASEINPSSQVQLAMAFDVSYRLTNTFDLVAGYSELGYGYGFAKLAIAIGF